MQTELAHRLNLCDGALILDLSVNGVFALPDQRRCDFLSTRSFTLIASADPVNYSVSHL